MTLTFDLIKPPVLILVDWIYQLLYHRLQGFLKKYIVLTFSYTKAYKTKFDLAVK